jgi:uncharacterized protein (DUF2235 family)
MAKNVAIFFDGTRNRLRVNGGTNVHALYEMACATGGTQQCLYVPGVGTERIKTAAIDALRDRAMLGRDYHRNLSGRAGRLFGALAGYGIGGRIREAYAFIVDHYDQAANDRLFLFGFSRGAFAARSLAGFVNEVGLLFRHHLSKVPEAYELYRSGEGREFLEANYSHMLGHRVRLGEGLHVYMIGVWDTVGALGLPLPFHKIARHTDHHLTRVMPLNVTHGRHALALHELRSIFAPVPWARSCKQKQSLEQVWFAGAHADVGGGYEDSTLSVTPLMWMAFEAEKLGLSLSHQVLYVQDSGKDVHHEIRGVFFFCWPRRRELLARLAESVEDEELATHSVHWSAIRRLGRMAAARRKYPYWPAVRAALARIDTLTRTVAARLAGYADSYSADDNSGLYGNQGAALQRVLESNDAWTPARLANLEEALVLVTLAHGWGKLAEVLGGVIDRLATEVCAANTAAEGTVREQRLHDTLVALRRVAEGLSGSRLRSFVDSIGAYSTLQHTLPIHTARTRLVKI